MATIYLIISIPLAWLLADAMSGIVHWVMDKRLTADGLFPGITADNELHHRSPRSILKHSVLGNIVTSWPALPISIALYFAGAPVFLWLSFAFLLFGNLVHRWAHCRADEVPRIVAWLQRRGILLSPGHHAGHHYTCGVITTRAGSVRRYCVMSDFINRYMEYWRS